MTGTIYVQFGEAPADPEITVGAGSGAFAVDPWKGAESDSAWRAEQKEFLDLAASADREALDQEP